MTADRVRERPRHFRTAAAAALLCCFATFLRAAEPPSAEPVPEESAETLVRQDDQDPLNRQPEPVAETATSSLELYASIRLRYVDVDGGPSGWEDRGSRAGIGGRTDIVPSVAVFGLYEMGFNLLDAFRFDDNNTQHGEAFKSSLFTRLAYVGAESGEQMVLFGKNWSTYYQVARFTDRFSTLGGDANGVYNAGTDGGPSGTGRADRVLQSRLRLDALPLLERSEPLTFDVQLQYGEPVPGIGDADYGVGFGISTVLDFANNIGVGFAYNYASVDLDAIAPEEREGLSGSMNAFLAGVRWFDDDWYTALTLSRTFNLQTTEGGTYFTGNSAELYLQRYLVADFWALAGYNYLQPDADQTQAGEYLLSYGILGLRYAIDGFDKMVYLEGRIDAGRAQDGGTVPDQLIAGLRWRF